MKVASALLFLLILTSCSSKHHPLLDSANEMVFISGGTFNMGNECDPTDTFALPVHQVEIEDFYLSRHEITRSNFNRFVRSTGYRTEAEKEAWAYSYTYLNDSSRKWEKKAISWKDPGFYQEDDHPVTCVSWEDAKAYCKWLSTSTDDKYRLPTESEWEYAARNGGTSIPNVWGTQNISAEVANFADRNTPYPWGDKQVDDGFAFTAPVGNYIANSLGIYDLAGNVWEWCENTISTYNGETVPGYETAKAMRGGSFHNGINNLRPYWRNYDDPHVRYFNLGFRVVKEID